VVPDYDDDDIIEDYEEISTDSPVRRVESAQGGPVRRPSAGVRPSTTAMPALGDEQGLPPKGKITRKSARNIWIVCIAITVLGLGAVIADVAFDAFGRGKGGVQPVDNGQAQDNRITPPPRRENLTERQKLEREFRSAVNAMIRDMDASRAWDFYWTAVLEFDHYYEQARILKNTEGVAAEDLEEGWAKSITHYYKAKYAAELFKHHFDKDGISKDYMPINVSSDEVEFLSDPDLNDARVRLYQAANSKLDSRATNVNKFRTDILKYEETARRVHESEEWAAKHFGPWQAKLEEANKGSFDPADLEFVSGPDYKPDEKKLFEEFLESIGG
jgi:hypothetical protein